MTMEYRGFELTRDTTDDAYWWAVAGGGLLNLGPFNSLEDAKAAVDHDLDWCG